MLTTSTRSPLIPLLEEPLASGIIQMALSKFFVMAATFVIEECSSAKLTHPFSLAVALAIFVILELALSLLVDQDKQLKVAPSVPLAQSAQLTLEHLLFALEESMAHLLEPLLVWSVLTDLDAKMEAQLLSMSALLVITARRRPPT